jgi:uncharacterized membrane protein
MDSNASVEYPRKKKPSSLDDRARLVLFLGVIISVIFMVTGIVTYFIKGTTDSSAVSIGDILQGLLKGNPLAIISMGILILIATPVLRVITVTLTMAENKDYSFMIIGIMVLVILFLSFIIAGFKT